METKFQVRSVCEVSNNFENSAETTANILEKLIRTTASVMRILKKARTLEEFLTNPSQSDATTGDAAAPAAAATA